MSIATKTRSSWPVSLSEAKRHLRIEDDFHEDDDYVQNLIYAATQKAEQWIGKDISETTNVQLIYDFSGSSIKITEGNFDSFTQGVTDGSTLLSVDYTEVFYNYANVYFNNSYSADPLTLTYKTGYEEEEVPAIIKQAILVKIGDLYDIERQSYVMGSIRENKAFEHLLDSYRYIQF